MQCKHRRLCGQAVDRTPADRCNYFAVCFVCQIVCYRDTAGTQHPNLLPCTFPPGILHIRFVNSPESLRCTSTALLACWLWGMICHYHKAHRVLGLRDPCNDLLHTPRTVGWGFGCPTSPPAACTLRCTHNVYNRGMTRRSPDTGNRTSVQASSGILRHCTHCRCGPQQAP